MIDVGGLKLFHPTRQITIYSTPDFSISVKFLYCPKCKEMRVKPWYSLRDRCSRCHGDVRVIEIPRTIWTYTIYGLTVTIFVTVFLHTQSDETNYTYLYVSIGLLIALMIIQFNEVIKGDRIARSKIKITRSDRNSMQRKGWR
jgi:hypothetical protein